MARIKPISANQWPEEMEGFDNPALSDTERDILGIHAYLPKTSRAFYRTRATLGHEGTLTPRLHELIRLRIAFFNQCRSCMSLRFVEIGEGAVCSLERPEESPDFSPAERSALRFAELLATDHLAIDEATYDELRLHFTEAEIVELGTTAALAVGMGRLHATWKVTDHVDAKYAAAGSVTPW